MAALVVWLPAASWALSKLNCFRLVWIVATTGAFGFLLSFLTSISALSNAIAYTVRGTELVKDGRVLVAGYFWVLQEAALIATSFAIGGAVFWSAVSILRGAHDTRGQV